MADVSISAVLPVPGAANAYGDGIAGTSVAVGDWVYRDAADSYKVKPADSSSSAKAAVVGIALHAATSGQPVRFQTAGKAVISGLSVGMVYVLSETSGGGNMCPVTDLDNTEYLTLLGAASGSAILDLKLWATGIQSSTNI